MYIIISMKLIREISYNSVVSDVLKARTSRTIRRKCTVSFTFTVLSRADRFTEEKIPETHGERRPSNRKSFE